MSWIHLSKGGMKFKYMPNSFTSSATCKSSAPSIRIVWCECTYMWPWRCIRPPLWCLGSLGWWPGTKHTSRPRLAWVRTSQYLLDNHAGLRSRLYVYVLFKKLCTIIYQKLRILAYQKYKMFIIFRGKYGNEDLKGSRLIRCFYCRLFLRHFKKYSRWQILKT